MKTRHLTTSITVTIVTMGTMLPGIAMAQEFPGPVAYTAGVTYQRPVISVAAAEQLNLQKAKILLGEMLDRLETHFENTKAKAATLQKLTEASGLDITQTIENYLSRIQTLKTEAKAAQTAAELKAVAQEVHNLILDAKLDVKKTIVNRVETHIDQFTQKTGQAEILFDSAQRRIDELKTEGKNIETVNNDLMGCQELMKKGKIDLQEAKSKLHEFQKLSRDQQERGVELMTEGIKNVRNARDIYGQARQNCSRVMRELKVLK